MPADGSLRIALVCPYSLSRPGGVQGQVTGLARALQGLGHQALVVAADDAGPGWSGPGRFTAGRSTGVRTNGSVAPVSLSPAAPWRALRACRSYGPHVVHLHEPLAPTVGYGIVLAGRWPTVGTFHRSGTSSAYRLAGPLARWARGRLDIGVAVSEAAARCAEDALGGSYEVLFNGIELDRFGPDRAGPHRAGGPAVLFVGRHEHRKGLGVLLEAWTQVRRAGVLWVAGDGPETGGLRRTYPDGPRVEWLGRLSDDEVASRMAGAAVVCAPSLGGESFGVVLLEAMASGTAVVASDIVGYREAAAGHATLVPPGDAAALARAIEGLLDDPPSAAALAGAAAHAAGWSMDELAARYVALYRRAIGSRTDGRVAGR